MTEQLNFRVKGKDYPIETPTVGKYVAIEATYQLLGKGYYNSLLESPMQSAENAVDMIHIEARVSILCPALLKDMKVSINELGTADFMELKKAYDEQFRPWWNEFLTSVNPKKEIVE